MSHPAWWPTLLDRYRYKVSHEISKGEWMYLTVCPLCGPDHTPAAVVYFKRFFTVWLCSANPSRVRLASKGSVSLQWHCITYGYRGGRPKPDHGQTVAEKTCSFVSPPGRERDRNKIRVSIALCLNGSIFLPHACNEEHNRNIYLHQQGWV